MSNSQMLKGLSMYLVRDQLIDLETALHVLENATKEHLSFNYYLVKHAYLSSEKLLAYCAKQFSLPIYDLQNFDIQQLKNNILTREFIVQYRILPIFHDNHHLQLAISDPADECMLAAIHFHTGLHIKPFLVAVEELEKIIENQFGFNQLNTQIHATLKKVTPLMEVSNLEPSIENDQPIIELVNQLIDHAIEKNASDIHIEPQAQHCRIRYRSDGLLYEATTLPQHLASRIVTRLKILANLNIAERRLPQDGRILLSDKKIDIRISTCPALHGEKMVLRILAANTPLDIHTLGFTPEQKTIFLKNLNQPQGLILVTGPTGSGKTLTLYSALHYLNVSTKNITSVEDPIEIELNGIHQVAVNPVIGLTFASVLRTFLRQDPDIIMVGEIRDAETAAIAIQAAQTGHLVLSTLHTNNAIEAIARLKAMDIPIYNLAHSLTLIIAQRLLRKLCEFCKTQDPHTLLYKAQGCQNCQEGYHGRVGVFECLPVTDTLNSHILENKNSDILRSTAKQHHYIELRELASNLLKQGMTTQAELIRVMGYE